MINLALACAEETLQEQAKALAARLHLSLDNQATNRLLLTLDGLALQLHPFSPVLADFTRKTWQKRHDAGKKQGLIRACKPGPGVKIIDATAGWGRDAAILASFGAEVLLLERNPVLGALLEDGLLRQDPGSQSAIKLSLKKCDSLEYLEKLGKDEWPDIIYIDPMHPERQKAALVKKELQALQQLIGPDRDIKELILMAQTRALKKVVVKWPQSLSGLVEPHQSISGKTVRFDIYLPSF